MCWFFQTLFRASEHCIQATVWNIYSYKGDCAKEVLISNSPALELVENQPWEQLSKKTKVIM